MADWHDGDRLDLVDQFFTLTTTIALRALFSSQLDPARAERLRRAFDVFLRGIYARAVLPRRPPARPRQPPLRPGRGNLARPGQRAHRQLPAVRSRPRRPDVPPARHPRRGRPGPVRAGLTNQVAVLMLAGGENTSAAVRGPGTCSLPTRGSCAAVPSTTDAVLDGDVADSAHLPRLDLIARIVREALRLYPPAWDLPRVSPPAQSPSRADPPAPHHGRPRPLTSCTAARPVSPRRPASTPPAGSPRLRTTGPPSSPSAPAPPGPSARSSA